MFEITKNEGSLYEQASRRTTNNCNCQLHT